jgi:hypothetical protein
MITTGGKKPPNTSIILEMIKKYQEFYSLLRTGLDRN